MAVLVCAQSGCWEEIHYQPPSGGEPVAVAPPRANETNDSSERSVASEESDAAAGDFGDDVANSLAEEPAPAAIDVGESPPIGAESEPPLDTTATEPPPATAPTASTSEPPADASTNSRLAAWSLGSTLSLAALANDRAASEDKVTGWFDTARQQASALGTTVADLPPRPSADQIDLEGKRAMEYLFGQGQVIGPHLGSTLGDDHNALFEVALKSNILLVRYQPEAPISELLAAAISQASERAKLPPELVQPVLQAVQAKAPVKDVRDAVFDMHAHVDRYLSTGQISGQP